MIINYKEIYTDEYDWNIYDITMILTRGYIPLNDPPNWDASKKQLFAVHLALSVNMDKDIPCKLLVEEINWIENYLGIPINNKPIEFYRALTKVLTEARNIIKEQASKNLWDEICDNYMDELILPEYIITRNEKQAIQNLKYIIEILKMSYGSSMLIPVSDYLKEQYKQLEIINNVPIKIKKLLLTNILD